MSQFVIKINSKFTGSCQIKCVYFILLCKPSLCNEKGWTKKLFRFSKNKPGIDKSVKVLTKL